MDHRIIRMTELRALVSSVPAGRVGSYGWLGRSLTNPVSGFLAGKWMAQVDDVPWWRIVGATGELLVAKRDPDLAVQQRRALEKEGVEFDESGLVRREFFWFGEE